MKMKIANLHATGGVGFYVHRSQRTAALKLGHAWLDWDGSQSQLDEFQPDFVILDVGRKNVNTPKGVKTGMIVSQWTDEPIWPELYQRGYQTKAQDILFVEQVDPTFLYHHCTQAGIEQGFKFWFERAGRPVHSIPLYADVSYFYHPDVHNDRVLDVCFVGGKWPYKSQVMDDYLVPVLANEDYKSVVYGNRGWDDVVPLVNFKGELPGDKEALIYHNTKVVPCCHEPHSHHGFDVVIRVFTPLLSGAAVVSDPNPSIYKEGIFKEDEIIVASNPDQYIEAVDYLVSNDRDRLRMVIKARDRVLCSYTVEHNLANMFDAAGFTKEAEDARRFALQRYEQLRHK